MRFFPEIRLSMLPEIPLGAALPDAEPGYTTQECPSKAAERRAYDQLRDAQAQAGQTASA